MGNTVGMQDHMVQVLMTSCAQPFAKALATFISELLRQDPAQLAALVSQIRSADSLPAGHRSGSSEEGLPASWEELPEALRKAVESEIQQNNKLLAAGKLECMEFGGNPSATIAANRLQQMMDRKEVTQKELARRLDVSPSFINKVFKQPDRSKVATLRRIAEALEVDLAEIL